MGKGRGAEGKDDGAAQDSRIMWLINRIHVALKIKVADLLKLCDNEDNQQTIKEFFENNDTRCLYVVQLKGQKGSELTLTTESSVPDEHKKKILFFMKVADEARRIQKINQGNIGQLVVFGDLSTNPVSTLELVTRHAFLPVMKVPENSTLSDVVRPSFMEELHHHLAHLLVTSGLTRGKTLLPLPPIEYPVSVQSQERQVAAGGDAQARPTWDKNLLYQLESTVVAWTAQVKSAMQNTPETMLETGHPGPKDEIEFWKQKRDNLLFLEEQLHSSKVLKIVTILKHAKSSYYRPFQELADKDLREATEEAKDNCRFLEPLGEIFHEIKAADESEAFEQLVSQGVFKRLLHYIYIVWTKSNHYNKPSRLVVLIREICNDLIEAARTNVNIDDLFTCEPPEAVARLSTTLSVCGHFKNWYFHYKSKASKDTSGGGRVRPWKFQNTTLFQRLDAFLERCHDLLDVLETVMLFSRLDRVEIGGTQGAELSGQVASIHKEFLNAYEEFYQPADPYDILDVDEKRFDVDFATFCSRVKRMEMRLGSMLTQSMEDSRALYNTFKLVDSYEGFLDRAIIQQEWQKRQHDILRAYHDDLLMVHECFYASKDDSNKDMVQHPLAYSPMPPTAAKLVWARGLLERISEPYSRINELSKPVLSSELAQETKKLYNHLQKALQSYTHACYEKWAGEVGAISTEKLKLSLLRREQGQVAVNFDGELVKMLREVNYLLVLNSFERQEDTFTVPPQADTLHKMREQFRHQILKLTVITDTYNNFQKEMLDVEKPLLVTELQQFEEELQRGLKRLNWHSSEIEDFIKSAMGNVTALDKIFSTFKSNINEMKDLLRQFTNEEKLLPLNPKEQKTMSVDDFRKKYEDHRRMREANLRERAEKLHQLSADSLATINELKQALGLPALEPDTEPWSNYVSYVNDIVKDLVCSSVVHSLRNLRDQVSTEWLKEHDGIPLLDVKLVLTNPGVMSAELPEARFLPYLSSKEGTGSVDTLVNEWIKDYNDMAQCVPRLDAVDDNYAQDVYAHKDANSAAKEINELISANAEQCHRFAQQYRDFSSLWERNREKEFETFLNPPKERAEHNDDDDDAPPPPPEEEDQERPHGHFFGVPLPQFEVEISKYEKLLEKIGELPGATTVGWLRIDAKPIRESMKTCCKQWIDMYTDFVIEKIDGELQALSEFMELAEAGLEEKVPTAGDSAGDEERSGALRRVLRVIRDCRVRDAPTTAMFGPISEGINTLRQHTETVDPAKLAPLEEQRKEAPDKWLALSKRVAAVRSGINELQNAESAQIKLRATDMEEDVILFRKKFQTLRPFHAKMDVDAAYDELMEWNHKLDEKEQEAKLLIDLQELFDLSPVELPSLPVCRQELQSLKNLWDMVGYVKSLFTDWKTQTFKNVDADGLREEAKNMLKQLKSKEFARCKNTGTHKWLCEEVEEMKTALPLVTELRHPSMRSRHWRQLLKRCGVDPNSVDPEAETFSLEDLFGLQLYNYAEDVGNFVERAQKEEQIEKQLDKITTYWENEAMFTYKHHEGLNCFLLESIDDIVEVLEGHLNDLNTLQSSRFVDEFEEQVGKWHKNLGMVESSMVKWMELQKLWMNLYPIFVESADIREQLQEDARAFQSIDDLYRAMMSKAHKHQSVIEVCCTDTIKRELQRDDDFEALLTHIEDTLKACQRKLNLYLEGKKKLFPRFFFISDSDLIDILSKGSDPVAVLKHMSKIIDSVERFSIKKGTKTAYDMVSIQDEVVPAVGEGIECEGPVEEWLNNCIDLMFKTVKAVIIEAHGMYVESPRATWVLERGYPGQAIVVASRIWYTLEMEQAFTQQEDGNDQALKEFYKQQQQQIFALINKVLGDLSKNERKLLVHLITIDVHARDVVQWLLDEKAENKDVFTWQSQLRYKLDDKGTSIIDICDFSIVNGYEYIGLPGCLVITKLTDRCYITLTQALRLRMGGAPAGPAGTGKTETTKDLARNLGIACYVFNCSDQMDYLSLGQIFKGLAMSGSWGCFDEFNRIPIQVLSVVATQVGSILNALKTKKKEFIFMGEKISIIPSVGEWITMNPGYAGRTELPENIKSLFRPCAMCVPDLRNICEIMLAAEGFQDATDLAKKFVTLYKLNKELLSPQAHYDWGLRAVKSVLYIAGGLKRGDPQTPERGVLLRALRDTNMAKLSRDDVFVFMGLIRALFPNLEVKPKVDQQLIDACTKTTATRKLLPGDVVGKTEVGIFILRCTQLHELLDVRHSVFVMGPAGCGKSEVWKTLSGALKVMGDQSSYKVMNPKAVTSDELYGYIHPATREWKDGLLSNIFRDYRDLSQTHEHSKWLVLDGIIDAEWIESMNTVMDDNKMLTLASNERIPLTSSMRMVFEIADVRNASPATVSRAGIIYINDTDLGWGPYKDRWVAARDDEKERQQLDNLFDKYVGHIFEYWKKYMPPPVPVNDLSVVQTICFLLEGLLTEENIAPGSPSEAYEKYFLFVLVWAFGGALSSDGRINYRDRFSAWWKKEFAQNTVRIVTDEKSTIYDVYIPDKNPNSIEYVPWTEKVKAYKHNPDLPFSDIAIDTVDTTRLTFLMDKLMERRRAAVFVGTAGTGKSNLIMNKLRSEPQSEVLFQMIAFNAMTRPKELQSVMENYLEKKHGKTFGPPGKKRLVYFIDDLNMPSPDKYGTQEAIEFVRLHIDYQFWYDRVKPGFPLKDVIMCQYVSAMNPKSGTFTVMDRLLRHFAFFACSMPDPDDLMLIYGSIMKGHWGSKWSKDARKLAEEVTKATVIIHQKVVKQFLPTAIKFHYQWNMREMFNIFQGLCRTQQKEHDKGTELVRLWVHECDRTFRDRMSTMRDQQLYDEVLNEVLDKEFSSVDIKAADCRESPIGETLNIWAPFGVDKDGTEGQLKDMGSFPELNKFLVDKLAEYNETNANMPLVLFENAMEHVCRICRVVSNPRGNAMLVGVGGSGKQSLSRLSAFIGGLDQFQIVVTAKYGINDFRLDLQNLYTRCGQKNQMFAFLITDGQIVVREMLVFLNDLLNSGNIPDLFAPDEMEGIQGSMLNEAKAAGIQELTPSVLWQFFINKVRANLHTILCFSPVGKQFSLWCRQFPALTNTTVIDWFHRWPEEALISVAQRFLDGIDLGDSLAAIADNMAFTHQKITEKCEDFLNEEKRYCYTTPKSFLELISLYKVLLAKKRGVVEQNKERLSSGIDKIQSASDQVADLQVKLKDEEATVQEKTLYTKTLVAKVTDEKETVAAEQSKAAVEEAKTNKVFMESEAMAAECARDLQAAQPIVEEALAALNSLRKEDLTELKALAKPPPDVGLVASSVMVLTADPKKIPPVKARDWGDSKKMMANISGWMRDLLQF
eukprot:Hpha_TRINITY_DN15501_c4_g2::TRINITY_DN15501_c4_g2_i2::g.105578::m.105578/K10408/DNAH; dynein heavy chain, axonemal